MPDAPVDGKYYQAAPPGSLGGRLTAIARDRIYDDFLRCCRPSEADAILDVGVSDVVNDAANVLERKYPHPNRITAAGLGTGDAFVAAFPLVRYVRIAPGRPLPFADASFDIATANAVLEHVGSRDRQRAFVGELLRVARKVFVSVPHRYFPVEHHTAIPLLHFSDRTFRLACRHLGKAEWATDDNLILMSRRRLAAACPAARDPVIGCTGILLGPFSSNLYLFAESPERS